MWDLLVVWALRVTVLGLIIWFVLNNSSTCESENANTASGPGAAAKDSTTTSEELKVSRDKLADSDGPETTVSSKSDMQNSGDNDDAPLLSSFGCEKNLSFEPEFAQIPKSMEFRRRSKLKDKKCEKMSVKLQVPASDTIKVTGVTVESESKSKVEKPSSPIESDSVGDADTHKSIQDESPPTETQKVSSESQDNTDMKTPTRSTRKGPDDVASPDTWPKPKSKFSEANFWSPSPDSKANRKVQDDQIHGVKFKDKSVNSEESLESRKFGVEESDEDSVNVDVRRKLKALSPANLTELEQLYRGLDKSAVKISEATYRALVEASLRAARWHDQASVDMLTPSNTSLSKSGNGLNDNLSPQKDTMTDLLALVNRGSEDKKEHDLSMHGYSQYQMSNGYQMDPKSLYNYMYGQFAAIPSAENLAQAASLAAASGENSNCTMTNNFDWSSHCQQIYQAQAAAWANHNAANGVSNPYGAAAAAASSHYFDGLGSSIESQCQSYWGESDVMERNTNEWGEIQHTEQSTKTITSDGDRAGTSSLTHSASPSTNDTGEDGGRKKKESFRQKLEAISKGSKGPGTSPEKVRNSSSCSYTSTQNNSNIFQ